MYDEADLLPISALQHLAFCERQWGLIHLEGVWEDNPLTVEGHHLHQRTDAPETEVRGAVRIARGLQLRSLRLGLVGKADVGELHRLPDAPRGAGADGVGGGGVRLGHVPGLWRPFPVEYKRGRPKAGPWDEVQLCAQALCLEEMLEVAVPQGALFYWQPRRRYEVAFREELRRETEALTARLHELARAERTPPGRYEKKCDRCSLISACMPKTAGAGKSARRYLSRSLALIEGEPP